MFSYTSIYLNNSVERDDDLIILNTAFCDAEE